MRSSSAFLSTSARKLQNTWPRMVSSSLWKTVTVDQHRQDHLAQVRAMVLAKTMAARRLAAGALEVEAGGVHEHQVEPREQVAPMREQPFFHHILGAARSKRRAAVLLLRRQLLAEPGHRAIKLMQREPL